DKTQIPSGYYKEMAYAGKWYLTATPGQGLPTCVAPLPSLTGGVTTALSGSLTLPPMTFNGSDLPPPPPPSACS
ncbi:MAG TPA: hypothetical protein VMI31_08985, partial [Fimbriimonadaceae bacterium]|nr:hypothetical protein [Fimbriimonadaceae bacterium]